MNNRRRLVLSILPALVCLPFALHAAQEKTQPGEDPASAPRVSQAEFRDLLAGDRVLILDVRDAEAYGNGHIPGARLLPLADIGQHAAQLRAEARPIVTYCA
jgi:3-mercaptopyruvate sulfurtransferase SseA